MAVVNCQTQHNTRLPKDAWPVFAHVSHRGLLHAASLPDRVVYMDGSGYQPRVTKTYCGKRGVVDVPVTPYRDLWPASSSSCTTCWRRWSRRFRRGVA